MSQKPNWRRGRRGGRTHKERVTYPQRKKDLGLLVTDELESALASCKERVGRIARECRARNRKFRDIEFDLENDRERCLHGLGSDETYEPADVQRITEIFKNPQFFIDGADSNDLVQGQIGNCWFISALATMATAGGLVEKFCVARDEKVGVYGFIFFRDNAWVTVIIDDMVFTAIPKFEELSAQEKQLYHNDKELYNNSARKNGKGLYFAKSGQQGETWVSLIEKAYAKLHGSYGALAGGFSSEAIEDLTGGVSTYIPTKDILDIDKFWKEELLKANVDRLFGCSYKSLNGARSGQDEVKINGLIGSHAYSVLRAVECKGKRFVVLRNPWGQGEWTGPWSDGSKEWTPEWLEILPKLGHFFGDDGQFVMEYKDFLDVWDHVDRTLLFDPIWVMSSQWLHVPARPPLSAWSYGDISFTFTLPEPSTTLIVLSQLDNRYFKKISGRCAWRFDFLLYKEGEDEYLAESAHSRFKSRSINLEIDLEAGNYVVHVRLDRLVLRDEDYMEKIVADIPERVLTRVLTERARARSIATNFDFMTEGMHLPLPLSCIAGRSLQQLKQSSIEEAAAAESRDEEDTPTIHVEEDDEEVDKVSEVADTISLSGSDPLEGEEYSRPPHEDGGKPLQGKPSQKQKSSADDDGEPEVSELNSLFLGLKVYTHKDAPATISGQLLHEI
ncbi:hypothetical protein Moror_15302 [Moniliophthora roreri MCA 2997]|uniref:Calpain catalytic domain-containing protein n=2 Tax=Moniliophthora roreri TaxID=221103 RepID=V2Y845_MONRO|nr:hypothetical protein Moror_15302 [Moniliophthora roreri MCA 2997]